MPDFIRCTDIIYTYIHIYTAGSAISVGAVSLQTAAGDAALADPHGGHARRGPTRPAAAVRVRRERVRPARVHPAGVRAAAAAAAHVPTLPDPAIAALPGRARAAVPRLHNTQPGLAGAVVDQQPALGGRLVGRRVLAARRPAQAAGAAPAPAPAARGGWRLHLVTDEPHTDSYQIAKTARVHR